MIYDNILQVVGKTPVVRLNRIGAELDCELYAKCEYLNPAGSVKDRIAVRMLDGLEKAGRHHDARQDESGEAGGPGSIRSGDHPHAHRGPA
jgi:cysteine synthase